MDEIKKRKLIFILIAGIIMSLVAIITVFYFIPEPSEETTEFEKESGYNINMPDFRPLVVIIFILNFVLFSGWIYLYYPKKNTKLLHNKEK